MVLVFRSVGSGVATSVACAGVALALGAQAPRAEPFDIKPGLWTLTANSQISGGPSMDVSKLSDQEKALLGPMLAQMPQPQNAPTVTRQCVTKEKLTQALFEPESSRVNKDTKCTHTLVTGRSSSQDSTFDCTGSNAGTGTVHVDRVTSESVTGNGTLAAKGQNMNVTFTFTGKWMGDDCRGIK
ncbi:MAG TPA: DUF3617 family protein [Vicinamibacterales bacterium]|nr:DUF3617 family protein [Vicinamibacterales bacterium]